MREITFGSLFAGIGGFDLGFERAGMTCKWQVEIDDYANRVLAKHWPDVRRHGDIRTFPPGPADDWRVDVICGGFPCQDISYAGAGAGLEGERSGLFYEAMRVVRVLEPRCVVLENVAALLTRGLPEVLGTLASLGFDAEWHCLPAAAFGAPHIRDRAFVLGYAKRTPENTLPATSCERLSACQSSIRNRLAIPGPIANTISERGEKRMAGQKPCDRWKARVVNHQSAASTRAEDWRAVGWWGSEPAVGRVADGVPARVDRLRGLGNAVVPQVAEWIGRRIVEALTTEPARASLE